MCQLNPTYPQRRTFMVCLLTTHAAMDKSTS